MAVGWSVVASDRRQELADFLRSRRGQITPDDVGIPSIGRRRTPGLRREEVSQLSGVSLTWYTWLEQARDINVSAQVLVAIARTLQLDQAETEHLLTLAGVVGSAALQAAAPGVDVPPASLERLLDALGPNPAYAISPRWDIVAWNASYAALFLDISRLPAPDRNLLWLVFTSPAVRSLLGDDWQDEARRLIAQFRAEVGHRLQEVAYLELIQRLVDESPEFGDWWSQHDVAYFASRQRHFDHPHAGLLVFDHHKLVVADHPDLRVIVYTPADDGRTERAFARALADIGPPARSPDP